MCGIAGHTFASGRERDLAALERMNAALVHRGPDEGGAIDVGFAAIGMRRLSIVDVRDGHQPMSSSDGRHALVYNGELYDFAAQRAELERRGARFRTRSDTEVLLQRLALEGERCLASLDGMFAFALADRAERTLLLARDPHGIKPLYYFAGERGELAFSSELSSLVAHPSVPRRLDRRSLESLLVDRYVADPYTLFEGVRQLPPGHALRWRDGRVETWRYCDARLAPEPIDEGAALERLRAILDETVRSQLVADVPVGVFLSGGVDSSTVAAFAARAVRESGRRIQSFSVGFADAAYDESALAREVARHLDTEHREVRVGEGDFALETLDFVLDHVGQPLGDTSCIPTYAVSKLAREHVKVVLSGDGGDEFFGGYDHMFWAARVRRVGERTPAALRRVGRAVLAGVSGVAPAAVATPVRRARKGLELSFHAPERQFRLLRALWTEDEARALVAHEVPPGGLRPEYAGDARALEHLAPEEYAMELLASTYMPGAILTKVDRMSMAASLEVRVPLLDLRVTDFARRLPLELKVRGRTGKHLLREAGRPLLPEAVYRHRKQGFSLPLFAWLNRDFWELADELFAPGSEASRLFRRGALARALAQGRSADARQGVVSETTAATRVWLLASIARWMQRFRVTA